MSQLCTTGGEPYGGVAFKSICIRMKLLKLSDPRAGPMYTGWPLKVHLPDPESQKAFAGH